MQTNCECSVEKIMTSIPGQKVDWEELAWDQGFKGDDRAMLSQWHYDDRLTMVAMGRRLNLCDTTVSKRMKELGLQLKPVPNSVNNRGPRLPK